MYCNAHIYKYALSHTHIYIYISLFVYEGDLNEITKNCKKVSTGNFLSSNHLKTGLNLIELLTKRSLIRLPNQPIAKTIICFLQTLIKIYY